MTGQRFQQKLVIALLFLLYATLPCGAEIAHILPRPKHIDVKQHIKPFYLQRSIRLEDPTDCLPLREFLQDYGCSVNEKAKAVVTIVLTKHLPNTVDYALEGYENEAYRLKITPHRIEITALSRLGVIRAAATLRQMAEGTGRKSDVAAVDITDYPSFKLRGYMHDTGRSYLSMQELKNEIKLLSLFKVNTFHWHLTENQAWRFEVKAFPQLTADTSMTRHQGLFYTQNECRELESYARGYGIQVIPEIDMPGHSEAFERAMGHSMQTDRGVNELKQILNEVAVAFPLATYIHIGGDEKTITYPDFLGLMTRHVRSLGRRAIVWIPNHAHYMAADMTQLWSTAGRLVPGIPNIDCRYNYINHFDVFADVVGIYKSNIYYQQQGSPEVAGEICALWNDHKLSSESDMLRQNNFYTNVIASASRAWQGGGRQYIEKGGTTLPVTGDELDDFQDWERRFLFHKSRWLKDAPIPYVRQSNVLWAVTDSLSPDRRPVNSLKVRGAGVYLRHTWSKIVPAWFTDKPTGKTAYVWTSVYSPKDQEAGALVELQNYSRSEQDKVPDEGQWDRRGSRIWWNGEPLKAPEWKRPGQRIDNETDLTNENFTGRPIMKLRLKKGWNHVRMILPDLKGDGIRLNKWMFTFVLTDVEGRNALPDIIYSPHDNVVFPQ